MMKIIGWATLWSGGLILYAANPMIAAGVAIVLLGATVLATS